MANRAPKTLMIRTRPSTIPLESIGSPSTDLEAPDGQYAVVSMETMEVMQERESDDHAKKEESIYTRIKMNLRVVLNHTNCRRLKNHFKTLILYFAFQIIVLYVEFAIFWETFVPFCGGKFALFVYLCFLLAAFVMYFFIFFSNPGYVKVISVSDAESDELEPSTIELNSEIKHLEKRDLLGPRGSGESKSSWNYCESCNAWRAPRSRHCDICGYCVVKFDHHCPFFNNW